DDGTDRATVQVRPNSLLMLEKYRQEKGGIFRPKLRLAAQEFFRRHNVELYGFSDYIRESVLEPGQLVVIFGRAAVLSSSERGPSGHRTVTFASREPLFITDDLRCGR